LGDGRWLIARYYPQTGTSLLRGSEKYLLGDNECMGVCVWMIWDWDDNSFDRKSWLCKNLLNVG
jgi:hypothetical protein